MKPIYSIGAIRPGISGLSADDGFAGRYRPHGDEFVILAPRRDRVPQLTFDISIYEPR